MIKDLLAGARYFYSGFTLIKQKGLRRYALIPVIINVLVFALLLFLGGETLDYFLAGWLPDGDVWWAKIARGLLWLLFGAAGLAMIFFSFTVLANLIGAPFNGRLAERVEQRLSKSGIKNPSVSLVHEASYAVRHELRKLMYFSVRALPLWLLTLIPGINVVTTPIWLLFTGWYLGMEYFDYPLSNHRTTFRQLLTESRKNRFLLTGFGLAAMTALLVPGLNLFVMPAAVAGATAMWAERKN